MFYNRNFLRIMYLPNLCIPLIKDLDFLMKCTFAFFTPIFYIPLSFMSHVIVQRFFNILEVDVCY